MAMRRFALVLFALAACKRPEYKAPPVDPLPADLVKEGEDRIAALQARSTELNALESTIDPDSWVPRPDLGACPIDRAGRPYALEIVTEGNELPRPGSVLSGKTHRALSELATALHATSPTAEAREAQIADIRAKIDAKPPEVAVVFVVDEWHDATFDVHSTSNAYEGGLVRGRAYAWDATKSTVVCAADVVATSSETMSVPVENTSVDVYYGRNDRGEIRTALDRDLRSRLEQAIAASLEHAAGPVPVAQPRKRPRR